MRYFELFQRIVLVLAAYRWAAQYIDPAENMVLFFFSSLSHHSVCSQLARLNYRLEITFHAGIRVFEANADNAGNAARSQCSSMNWTSVGLCSPQTAGDNTTTKMAMTETIRARVKILRARVDGVRRGEVRQGKAWVGRSLARANAPRTHFNYASSFWGAR